MTGKIRVLIADDVPATRENICKLMQFHPEIEAVGQAGTGEEAISLAKTLRPDIVLMDINMPGMDGIAATERLSVEVPETAIIIMSVQGEQEYLRRAMMAGAKNYLTKPFTGDELVNAVRDAHSREQKIRSSLRLQTGVRAPGKIISVFSGKGGVGKTTIAVNLAVAFSQRPETRVAIVDADLQFGDVALLLNLLPRSTLADVLADVGDLDEQTLASYMTLYNAQLQMLAAPLRPEQAEKVTALLITGVLKQLRKSYDYIVVDTSSAFNEATISVLDSSDTILVVAALDLPAVKNTKLSLEVMQSLGYGGEKVLLVLNRDNSEGGIDSGEVEESLKQKFFVTIPGDERTVVNSVNKGLPFVALYPDTLVSQRIKLLCDRVAPQETFSTGVTEKSARRFKFFGR